MPLSAAFCVASRVASGTCVVCAFALAALLPLRAFAEDVPSQPMLGPPTPDGLAIPFKLVAGNTSVRFPPSHAPVWEASGGATLTYEAITIAADSMDYTFTPYPGLKAGTLDHARLEPGPKGPLPDHIRIDSRASQLNEIGFRGLLTPVSAEVDRLGVDGAPAGMIRYQIRLDQLGDWDGMVRTQGDERSELQAPGANKPAAAAHPEWMPLAGWADHALLVMLVPVDKGTTGRRRLESAVFFGAPKGRLAEVRMLDAPPPGTEATAAENPKAAHPIPVERGAVLSDRLSLIFNADGTISHIDGINETRGDISALGQLNAKRN